MMTPDEIRDAVNRKQAEEYAVWQYKRRGGYSSSVPDDEWLKRFLKSPFCKWSCRLFLALGIIEGVLISEYKAVIGMVVFFIAFEINEWLTAKLNEWLTAKR